MPEGIRTEDGMTKLLKYGGAGYKKKCRVMLGGTANGHHAFMAKKC